MDVHKVTVSSIKTDVIIEIVFQVREPRKELERYGGELSGIKASVRKSIPIK
jgi:hypothetical protein